MQRGPLTESLHHWAQQRQVGELVPVPLEKQHLAQVRIPMLFLQGDRDEFADLTLLRPVVQRLGERATLHLVEGGDHSFHVLKRSGRTDADVMTELVATVDRWATKLLGG